MKQGTNYYFYHNNHLGTTQKLTSTNGAVVWSATYTFFGEATVEGSSTITNNLRFPGQYYDQETGLHYNYHRYYCPIIGRYLRSDDFGIRYGFGNLYVYAKSNPMAYIDALGLEECKFMHKIPVGISVKVERTELSWSKWYYLNHGSQRGFGPYYNIECYCQKKRLVYKAYVIKFKWKNLYKCYDECREWTKAEYTESEVRSKERRVWEKEIRRVSLGWNASKGLLAKEACKEKCSKLQP